MFFMQFQHAVFGDSIFVITESTLFGNAVFPTGGHGRREAKIKGNNAAGRGNSVWDCTEIYYCGTPWAEECIGPGGCDYDTGCPTGQCFLYYADCTCILGCSGGGGGTYGDPPPGSGGGGGGTPPPPESNCQPPVVNRGADAPLPGSGCPPGWVPNPPPGNPPPPEPVDSLLNRYSRALKDTAIYIYDNLSQPNNVEYALTGIWQDNQVKIIERRTNGDSLQVFPKVMIGNLILLFTWHSHVSRSAELADRGSFSPNDIEMLRHVRCLKQNFISFADCRNKRYALVITDLTKATLFFNNNTKENILDNYTTTLSGTKQEKEEASIKNVIGSYAANGISFYVSNDGPNFQSWTLLNP